MASPDTESPDVEPELEETFDRAVEEGERRLARKWPSLIVTGLVGGLDVGTGVLFYLVVLSRTHDDTLAGLAFTIGFIALTLGQSELFTEDFLIPVTAVVARRGTVVALGRLWLVTLVMNLVGGWVISWLIVTAFPNLHATIEMTGAHYAALRGTSHGFALAVLAGGVMALLTWMQHSTESTGIQLVPAIAFSALLAGGQLFHSILDSLFMFTALHFAHASFGYVAWLGALGWSVAGNLVGGVGLGAVLRLVQVPHKVAAERDEAAGRAGRR